MRVLRPSSSSLRFAASKASISLAKPTVPKRLYCCSAMAATVTGVGHHLRQRWRDVLCGPGTARGDCRTMAQLRRFRGSSVQPLGRVADLLTAVACEQTIVEIAETLVRHDTHEAHFRRATRAGWRSDRQRLRIGLVTLGRHADLRSLQPSGSWRNIAATRPPKKAAGPSIQRSYRH